MSHITESLRRQVVSRAGGRCEYCLIPPEGQVARFHIDHVIPRNRGGKTDLSNLALACPHCNGHKWTSWSGVDPDTGKTVALFNPRKQAWQDHFRWSEVSRYEIEGITSCGRATVSRLRMNDGDMVTVRRLLHQLGIRLGATT